MPAMLRFALGVPAAAGIAILLFIGMRGLIAIGAIPVEEPEVREKVDIFQKPPPDIKEPVRTEPEFVSPPPAPKRFETETKVTPTAPEHKVAGIVPAFSLTIEGGEAGPIQIDQNPQPIVRIPPSYPPRASQAGKEGHCDLVFDVGLNGAPMNIRAACTDAVFAKSAERAVEGWKYNPGVRDGAPVVMRGVQTRILFDLDG